MPTVRRRSLDINGFPGVTFRGEYPIGTVEYRDDACPIAVTLEAFSPFIPLNTEDSSLPATILHFTLRNSSNALVEATLVGSLENAVLLHHREVGGRRVGRRVAGTGYTLLEFSAEKSRDPQPTRPDVLFEDWNKETYDGWIAAGDAFGSGPVLKSRILDYQGDVAGDTARVVNSHASAPGKSLTERDNAARQADKPPVHDRAQLHPSVDRGREPQGQDLRQRRRRREGRPERDRPEQQQDGPTNPGRAPAPGE